MEALYEIVFSGENFMQDELRVLAYEFDGVTPRDSILVNCALSRMYEPDRANLAIRYVGMEFDITYRDRLGKSSVIWRIYE